jgi:hypothetical protein
MNSDLTNSQQKQRPTMVTSSLSSVVDLEKKRERRRREMATSDENCILPLFKKHIDII